MHGAPWKHRISLSCLFPPVDQKQSQREIILHHRTKPGSLVWPGYLHRCSKNDNLPYSSYICFAENFLQSDTTKWLSTAQQHSAYKLNEQGDNIQPLHTCFPILNPIHCSMYSSNYCFLICMQVSLEAGKVIWYSHLFKNFFSFLWSTQSKTLAQLMKQKMFFWNSLAFSMIQQKLAIWSLVPLPFPNPACASGSSQFTYCWSIAWRILNITFASLWNEHSCATVWIFFGIDPSLGLEWKLTFSSSVSTVKQTAV